MLMPQTGVQRNDLNKQDHASEVGVGYYTEVCTPVRMGP